VSRRGAERPERGLAETRARCAPAAHRLTPLESRRLACEAAPAPAHDLGLTAAPPSGGCSSAGWLVLDSSSSDPRRLPTRIRAPAMKESEAAQARYPSYAFRWCQCRGSVNVDHDEPMAKMADRRSRADHPPDRHRRALGPSGHDRLAAAPLPSRAAPNAAEHEGQRSQPSHCAQVSPRSARTRQISPNAAMNKLSHPSGTGPR